MSRFLNIYFRDKVITDNIQKKIEDLSKRLAPENIDIQRPIIKKGRQYIVCLFNPCPTVSFIDNCMCMGFVYDHEMNWNRIGSAFPEGSYVIVRAEEKEVEILTDATASRTVWYLKTENMFVASSSIRAIVCILGSFQLNMMAYAWMLSSGTLGPGYCWDARLKMMPPHSCLRFDANDWELSLSVNEIEFKQENSDFEKFKEESISILKNNIKKIEPKKYRWIVPLSGGYDSRFLSLLLKERENFLTVTWGTPQAENDPDGDAFIANQVSAALKMPHIYFPLSLRELSAETILTRYLSIGEGRVDHVGGYLDGFELWKKLYEKGYHSILRGDICWPYRGTPTHDFYARNGFWITRINDYRNLPTFSELELPEQKIPEGLKIKKSETLLTYKDRIFHSFQHPITLAALNEIKAAYLEVINPLISINMIQLMRNQVDEIRANKKLICDYVMKNGPDIKMAKKSSVLNANQFLHRADLGEFLYEEIDSDFGRRKLSKRVIQLSKIGCSKMGGNLKIEKSTRLIRNLKNYTFGVGNILKEKITGNKVILKPDMKMEVFALRAYISLKMSKLLEEDAKYLNLMRN